MKKFKDAFSGLKVGINHKAIRIQMLLAILAIIGGLIVKLDEYEWLAFIICISVVIALEIMNTAIEKICDYVNSDYDEKIKVIKDLSSASVLFASIGAFVVCVIVCLRRII